MASWTVSEGFPVARCISWESNRRLVPLGPLAERTTQAVCAGKTANVGKGSHLDPGTSRKKVFGVHHSHW